MDLYQTLFDRSVNGGGGGGGGGSSDFTTAKVTFACGAEDQGKGEGYIQLAFVGEGTVDTGIELPQNSGESITVDVILYKNNTHFLMNPDALISMSGNISGDLLVEDLTITGDCVVNYYGFGE